MDKKIQRITPAFKDYLWGGDQLKIAYHKHTNLSPLAESWEVSTHPDGKSQINGEDLESYLKARPGSLGPKVAGGDVPILIKLIDAKQTLSIQVHPDNDYARLHENDNGKTEMWYVVDAAEDACLYVGLKEALNKDELKASIEDGSLEEKLNKVPVKKGDTYFIKPGTIHAIGAGVLIYEIQQRSNVTYRLYDFKRKDAQGKERDLHISQALDVAHLEVQSWDPSPDKIIQQTDHTTISLLRSCEYFTVYHYQVTGEVILENTDDSCHFLTLLDGEANLSGENTINLKKGQTAFIPSYAGPVTFSGKGDFIYASL